MNLPVFNGEFYRELEFMGKVEGNGKIPGKSTWKLAGRVVETWCRRIVNCEWTNCRIRWLSERFRSSCWQRLVSLSHENERKRLI